MPARHADRLVSGDSCVALGWEAPFNPDGTVNAARRFEKGRVYPEFLAWRPSLDRLPVAATRKRAGRVQGGVAIL